MSWKADKVPYNPITGVMADVTKAETWTTLAVAQKHFDPTVYSGLGCVIVKPYVGIDLDKCRNPETGEIEPWALEIIQGIVFTFG